MQQFFNLEKEREKQQHKTINTEEIFSYNFGGIERRNFFIFHVERFLKKIF